MLNQKTVQNVEIKFIDKDQIWQHETTRYWFNVQAQNENNQTLHYEIGLDDSNGEYSLVDEQGYPVEMHDSPALQFIFDLLIDAHEAYVND